MPATQEQIYQMGGAAGTGLVCTVVRRKGVGDLFDLIFAAGLGAIGFLAGSSLRGAQANLAAGMMDGAAAYIGSRIPEMLGTKTGTKMASYPAAYPVQVSYTPSYAPSATSVVEI